MTPRLSHHLTCKPGWLSHAASRLRYLAAACAVTGAIAGVVIAQAGPAVADPVFVYVAVGGDVTQDFMNQFALDIGGNELASYNATGSSPITPKASCSIPRPNGTDAGLTLLRSNSPCVDIVRAGTGPGTNANVAGPLVYIPLAIDAIAAATGPTSGPAATAITTADLFTRTDLVNLYDNCATITEGGVTYNPNIATAGQVQINLYVPQPGSTTLSFWASFFGFSQTSLPSCLHQTIVAGPNAGTPVQENNGLAVASDPNGYMPYSIAQWISQSNGNVPDLRDGAVLRSMSGITPCVGGACPARGGNLNSNFPTVFEVYNVVHYDRVVNTGDGNFDPILTSLLVGTSSAMCQDEFAILSYGFGLLPGTITTDTCGSTANSLRSN